MNARSRSPDRPPVIDDLRSGTPLALPGIKMANRIGTTLPRPTLAQRLASTSTADLMIAARTLASQPGVASDRACTAALEELERRVPGASFDSFVAEIYS